MIFSLFFALFTAHAASADSSFEIVRYLGAGGSFGQSSLAIICGDEPGPCAVREAVNGRTEGMGEIGAEEARKALEAFSKEAGTTEARTATDSALRWSLHLNGKDLSGQMPRQGNKPDALMAALLKLELLMKGRLK